MNNLPTTIKSQFSVMESIYSGLNLIQVGSLELSTYLELGSLITRPSSLHKSHNVKCSLVVLKIQDKPTGF